MIQDIFPQKLDNTFHRISPSKDSRILAFKDHKIYAKCEDGMTFLTWEMVTDWCRNQKIGVPETMYLFSINRTTYFLINLNRDFVQEGFLWHKMFSIRRMQPKTEVFAAATAWHLYVWYREHQFCGCCARKLVHSKTERMLQCPVCGTMAFPKIAPAVIIGLTHGDRIMMTKYAGREYKNYALIAGFTEIGETAEETVAREVMEEVGLKVKNIRYYKSQPWGFDSNLLMGFFCDLAEEGEIRLQEEELALAEWIDYRQVPDDPEGISLTREMMVYFRKKRENGENP